MSSSPGSAAADAPAYVLRDDANGIARLTLNRPAARNALSMEMMASLMRQRHP